MTADTIAGGMEGGEAPPTKDAIAKTEKKDWPITEQVQKLLKLNGNNGVKPKSLGVTWSDLTVKGLSNDAAFNENVLSQFNPFGKGGNDEPLKTIIHASSGCVKPGGMLLYIQALNHSNESCSQITRDAPRSR